MISDMYVFAIFYGIMMSCTMVHLIDLSKKDIDCRYAAPKDWRYVWLPSITLFLVNILLLAPHHPDWIVASLIWIVITYLLAKIPQIRIMGGNDARVMICAGLMFPHWLTIPVVFCVGLIAAHIMKKRETDEVREDWKRRGIPMMPFLACGWLVSAVVFQMMFLFI